MTIPEMFRLQGIDPSSMRVDVSNVSIGQQIGNAMSVNVVERILRQAILAANLTHYTNDTLPDRWKSGDALASIQHTAGQAEKIAKSKRDKKEKVQKPRSILKKSTLQ